MSLFTHRTAAVLSWRLLPILFIPLALAACALSDAELPGSDLAKVKKEQEEPRKQGTGRNFEAQTRVESAPVPAAAPGWDVERVASGQDDWEPAVAVDPINPNLVYQLITRYTGPKPCGNCKLPAIVLRRSTNGGQTWLADQWLKQTSKMQFDPQIRVDINGHVHAAFLNSTTPGTTYVKSTNQGVTWTPLRESAT